MNHSFNVNLAMEHGIEEAIIIENLAFWLKKNIANKKNFFEGRYWTYNSSSAFNELFPYINKIKIFRVLAKLEEKEIILSGNFNKLKFDRTKWYTIIDESILQMYDLHISKSEFPYFKMKNGYAQNETTIPDINTDINTGINSYIKIDQKEEKQSIKEYIDLVVKITDSNLFQVQQVINLSLLRDYDINFIILKIKESDFLMGKLEVKPTIRNFTQKIMIDKIIVDFYKNKKTNVKDTVYNNKQDPNFDKELDKILEGVR